MNNFSKVLAFKLNYMENTENKIDPKEAFSESQKNCRHKPLGVLILATIILSAFFGGVFGLMSGVMAPKILGKFNNRFQKNQKQDQQNVQISKEKIVVEDSVVTDMVEKKSPSVVSIVISKDVPIFKQSFDQFGGSDFFDPFGFFGDQRDQRNQQSPETEKKKIGGGTGFIVSADGMIVTNKHVVTDTAADYTVVMSDGKEYPAKVLARDLVKDVAIIKIDGNDFPVLDLGDSDSLKVGQTAIAIGNSLGEFSNTVSKGIISGLKRSLTAGSGFGRTERLNDIVQTDAAINPGNSGGPLLNIDGEVIGINVAVAQGAQNVGFAIPINQVKKIIDQVQKDGKISTPFLGVRYLPIDKNLQKENNLQFDYGVIVSRGEKMTDFAVIPGSPADKAGIVENDIILEINGEKLDDANALSDTIAKFNVGDEIVLKVWHKGEIKEIKVKLEERK